MRDMTPLIFQIMTSLKLTREFKLRWQPLIRASIGEWATLKHSQPTKIVLIGVVHQIISLSMHKRQSKY